MSDTGIIILAAGSSSRLGRPKQILPYRNKPLIVQLVEEAIKAELHPIVVVTGANAEQVFNILDTEQVNIIYNDRWQEGMGTGVVAGISNVLSLNYHLEAVIVSVCDQPFLSALLFHKLIEKKIDSKKGIIACTYADTIGVPVLFEHKYFEELLLLNGEQGAKKILKQYIHDVATISFPQGDIDIDTEEDYNNLLDSQ